MPVSYPDWLEAVLHRLGGTLAPLALVSVGLSFASPRSAATARRWRWVSATSWCSARCLLAMLYVGMLGQAGETAAGHAVRGGNGPQIGASIIAIQHGLNPPLVTLMVGIGTLLSFVTLPVWWTCSPRCSGAQS